MGKQKDSQAYICYKDARRQYRKACRHALNFSLRHNYDLVSNLLKTKKHGEFWNLIRRYRRNDVNPDSISVETLESHFRRKFSGPVQSDYINHAKTQVEEKLASLEEENFSDIFISEAKVTRLIKTLKSGSSPGIDGICAEHLKYSIGTPLILHLCSLLTLCLRFGLVPPHSTQEFKCLHSKCTRR